MVLHLATVAAVVVPTSAILPLHRLMIVATKIPTFPKVATVHRHPCTATTRLLIRHRDTTIDLRGITDRRLMDVHPCRIILIIITSSNNKFLLPRMVVKAVIAIAIVTTIRIAVVATPPRRLDAPLPHRLIAVHEVGMKSHRPMRTIISIMIATTINNNIITTMAMMQAMTMARKVPGVPWLMFSRLTKKRCAVGCKRLRLQKRKRRWKSSNRLPTIVA